MALFKRLNKDATGVGQDLNISPDNILGALFEEDVRPPRRIDSGPVRIPEVSEDVFVGQKKSRFSNAANLGLNRLF